MQTWAHPKYGDRLDVGLVRQVEDGIEALKVWLPRMARHCLTSYRSARQMLGVGMSPPISSSSGLMWACGGFVTSHDEKGVTDCVGAAQPGA